MEKIIQQRDKFIIEGLDCLACASKIENAMRCEGIDYASVNYATRSVRLEPDDVAHARQVVKRVEKGISLVKPQRAMKKYILNGLQCAGCGQKIQRSLDSSNEIGEAIINLSNNTILIDPEEKNKVEAIVKAIEPDVSLEEAGLPQEEALQSGKNLQLYSIIAAAALLGAGIVFNAELRNTSYRWAEYGIFLTAYFLVGWKVVGKAFENILRGDVFEEHFLMTVATSGAILIHQLPEAVGVMLFYNVGEYFQEKAVNRSRKSIQALLDIKPDYANLKYHGELQKVAPESVKIGDVIVIKAGERVPLDGIVQEGKSFLDTSALTGEAVPREVRPGGEVLAGMINNTGMLTVKVNRDFSETSVAKILELVENAGARKAPVERFITRFSHYYTPAVVFGAIALALLPPLFITQATFAEWAYRALVLLVISCPCALVISIPLGYFGGIGGASRQGILVKGANFLDVLTDLHTVVFDKTGTITRGVFRVADIKAENGFSREEVLKYAGIAESHSLHPIALSIQEACQGIANIEEVQEYTEVAGCGVGGGYQGKRIIAGNERMMAQEGINYISCTAEGTVVYIAVDRTYAGCILIGDEIKPDVSRALHELKNLGVERTVMLTGDNAGAAEKVAEQLGFDLVFADLLPEKKVARVEELLASLDGRGRLAYVGDGINDAPVLTRADLGIAMGGLGSDAAIEASDVVIMDDRLSRLPEAIRIARKTRRIVIQNIILALGIKSIFIIMGAAGLATMWEAVFADVGVALLAVLNSSRVLRSRVQAGLRP